MWRVTPEGRRFLNRQAMACGGRLALSCRLAIGKNQIKPLLDDPEHRITAQTLEKIRHGCVGFREGLHYERHRESQGCTLCLARDRNPGMQLTWHDQRSIQTLYRALWENPAFTELRPVLDPPERFNSWFRVWGNVTAEMPSEQFFVYRAFRDKVISFLFGERRLRDARSPYAVFAIWYLVGVANAFYDNSPVGLDADDEKALPLGERESAVKLGIRLLEELRMERSLDFITFEVEASELARPDSLARMLFRVYARAEEEVRHHFAEDPFFRNARFYVLDFPYTVPVEGTQPDEVSLARHTLVCCPLRENVRRLFQAGAVSPDVVEKLLSSLYPMYWNYFDKDSLTRKRMMAATVRAQQAFSRDYVDKGQNVSCYTLPSYLRSGFGKSPDVVSPATETTPANR